MCSPGAVLLQHCPYTRIRFCICVPLVYLYTRIPIGVLVIDDDIKCHFIFVQSADCVDLDNTYSNAAFSKRVWIVAKGCNNCQHSDVSLPNI